MIVDNESDKRMRGEGPGPLPGSGPSPRAILGAVLGLRPAAWTSTVMTGSTSAWRWTVTSCVPTERIGSSRWTSRRSTETPACAESASAMSAAVTEPNSLPSSPARAVTTTGVWMMRAASGLELALLGRGPRLMGPLEALGVADRALLGPHGQTARDQEVAGVAVGDVGDVARVAEAFDRLLQDDLHRVAGSYRLEYGSRAISRAFLTAEATSRWCCTQLPVTRRARILPRSDTNLRSVITSL